MPDAATHQPPQQKQMSQKFESVANVQRATWDKEEYAKKAKERAEREEAGAEAETRVAKRSYSDTLQMRNPLQAREERLTLASKVGKSQVITSATHVSEQGGYYCETCECTLRDSNAYLDHINGKKHNRALGMSMRTERSSVEDVKARLANHQPAAVEKTRQAVVEDLDARIDKLRQEEEEKKEKKKAAKRARKEEEEAANAEFVDEDAAAMMGFGSFGSSKK